MRWSPRSQTMRSRSGAPSQPQPSHSRSLLTDRAPSQPEVAGDEHELDLRGALPDLQDLRVAVVAGHQVLVHEAVAAVHLGDRKSTRLNSSHVATSYAVF